MSARAGGRVRLLLEDQHIPRARGLRLNEPFPAVDRDGAEDVPVEAERPLGVADLEREMGQSSRTNHFAGAKHVNGIQPAWPSVSVAQTQP